MKFIQTKCNSLLLFATQVRFYQIKRESIQIENQFFHSRILSYFLSQSSLLFAYAISPDKKHYETSYSHNDFTIATQKIIQEVQFFYPKVNFEAIDPGLILDWDVSESEKIVSLLPENNLIFDSQANRIEPLFSRIGFLFEQSSSYLGNCQFCTQDQCNYRTHSFDKNLFHRIMNEK